MTPAINWQTSEWDFAAIAAYIEPGLELSVDLGENGSYCWQVRLTSEVSEVPETWSIGFERTQSAAKAKCEASALKAAPTLTKRPDEREW